jgi:hypothetical protein
MIANRLMILGAVLAFSASSGLCRSLQHGEPRCRIRECPGLYRTNHRFHSS